MVLFLNVKINQKVLVSHRQRVIPATVRYKGHLNAEEGEWVGLELDYPFGKHNGTWRGWQYFSCSARCGLFTHASNIKFYPAVQRSRNKYRRVSETPDVDETLFYTDTPEVESKRSPRIVNQEYIRRARTAFRDPPRQYNEFNVERRFPLSHAISRSVPAATSLIPDVAMKQFQYISEPIHQEYATSYRNFNSSCSIPHYTMPHDDQLRQKRRPGTWEDYGTKPPRFSTV
ncbi:uncharacterized protein LOC144428299 [Styela clava]